MKGKEVCKMIIREILPKDDAALAKIVRDILKAHDLAQPGTAYFDPELDHLSSFYIGAEGRNYFVAVDDDGAVIGGCGFAEFNGDHSIAEMQKLYIMPKMQGKGISTGLIDMVEKGAAEAGYGELYLETHHNLAKAVDVYKAKGYTRLKNSRSGSLHQLMDIFFVKELKNK